MKLMKLTPDKIAVPGEYEIANESILKIYFRVFERGCEKALPPVLVINGPKIIDKKERQKKLEEKIDHFLEWGRVYNRLHDVSKYIQFFKSDYKIFERIISIYPYYLIDGNHRSIAAALTHKKIPSLELECDDDLTKIKEMIEKGELFNFNREENLLKDLALKFEEFILGDKLQLYSQNLKNFMSLKNRVDKLASNGKLPEYMKETYLRGKNEGTPKKDSC